MIGHISFSKMQALLEKWAPLRTAPLPIGKPPELRLATEEDGGCCESCVFFTFRAGSALLGPGHCIQFQAPVLPGQICEAHQTAPTFAEAEAVASVAPRRRVVSYPPEDT